jgi:hypothetical protein
MRQGEISFSIRYEFPHLEFHNNSDYHIASRHNWVSRYIPESCVMAASEVDAGNLQVTAIDVALVERDAAIDAHLLVRAAPHRIVGAFHDRIAFTIREGHGAVLGVVSALPVDGRQKEQEKNYKNRVKWIDIRWYGMV